MQRSADVGGYRKRVELMEKLYMGFNELRPPFCNQMAVEGTGRVDEADLGRALLWSSEVNPGATLRAQGHLGQMAWVRGPYPRLTVIREARWDGRNEREAPFLHATLDPERGPSCEVQYVEAGPRTFFVFRSLHAVMDGAGHRGWARDFFTALGGGKPAGHPDVLCSHEVARSLTSERLRFPKADALHPCGVADAVTSGNDYQWRRLTLERSKSSAMLADVAIRLATEARRQAQANGHSQGQGQGPVRVSVPVDFRHFRPEVRTTGNLIGPLFMEIPPDDTRSSFLERLRRMLKSREHARLPLGYAQWSWLPMPVLTWMLAGAFAKEHQRGRYALSATISDLGDFDASDCTAAGFTGNAAFFIPPFADQYCFVTLNGFEDRTDVMLALPSVFCSRGRLDGLLEALKEALEAG